MAMRDRSQTQQHSNIKQDWKPFLFAVSKNTLPENENKSGSKFLDSEMKTMWTTKFA